jgi:hypothetical protein
VSNRQSFSQRSWFLTNSDLAHGMVSKDYDNICRTERSANQLSSFRQTENWMSVCPILCGKHLPRHKWHLILYDIVGCPSQFMGQGIVRDHQVCLFHFAVIVVSRLGIEAPG